MIARFSRWWRAFTSHRRKSRMWESKIIVHLDDLGISATYPPSANRPEGMTCAIAWSDVRCVAIETNDSGPWGPDFWYRFEGEQTYCAFPQGASGDLDAFQQLSNPFPGFDFKPFMSACSSTSNARFVCWNRSKHE